VRMSRLGMGQREGEVKAQVKGWRAGAVGLKGDKLGRR